MTAIMTSCAPVQDVTPTGPLVQAIEGTPPPVPTGGVPTRRPAPTTAGGAFATQPPALSVGVTAQATTRPITIVPAGATATTPATAPAVIPAATVTPFPTANLTLPPTLPPSSTPVPSATGTPSRTPSATITRIPTPIVTTGWNLLQYNVVVDTFGDMHLLGLLENSSGQSQEAPDLTALFKNAGGQVVAEGTGSTEIFFIPPGWKAPFHIVTSAASYTTFEVVVGEYPSTEAVRADLTVSNVQVTLEGSLYVVTGTITNPGADLLAVAEIAVALSDASGKVIGVSSNALLAQDLGSGVTADFRVEVGEYFGTPAGSPLVVAIGL